VEVRGKKKQEKSCLMSHREKARESILFLGPNDGSDEMDYICHAKACTRIRRSIDWVNQYNGIENKMMKRERNGLNYLQRHTKLNATLCAGPCARVRIYMER
jgi:hypothetical protein